MGVQAKNSTTTRPLLEPPIRAKCVKNVNDMHYEAHERGCREEGGNVLGKGARAGGWAADGGRHARSRVGSTWVEHPNPSFVID